MSKKPKAETSAEVPAVDVKAAIVRLWKGGEHRKAALIARRAGMVDELVKEIPDDAAGIAEAVNNITHEDLANG